MPGGLHPSLATMASWPQANYVNPPRQSWAVTDFIIALTVLTTLVVSLRLWARFQQNFGVDDVFILAAIVPTIGLTVAMCLAYRKFHWGTHVWDLKIDQLVTGRKVVMATDSLYIFSTGLTKISILLFYRRIAAGIVTSTFLMAVHASIISVLAYMITFHATIFLTCRPMNSWWNQVDPAWEVLHRGKYSCTSELGTALAASIISVLQDFIACGLPSILLWKLAMQKTTKFLLASIFAVGFFICICGVLRTIYIARLYTTTYDLTWESRPVWILTVIEANLAIICASTPALRKFFAGSRGRSPFRPGYVWSDTINSGKANKDHSKLEAEDDAAINVLKGSTAYVVK